MLLQGGHVVYWYFLRVSGAALIIRIFRYLPGVFIGLVFFDMKIPSGFIE